MGLTRQTTRLALLAMLLALPQGLNAECFYLNGEEGDDTHIPCDADANHSSCCASNKARPDICLSSGLCYAQEPGYEGLIYMNGCTDESHEDPACPTVCNSWLETQDLDGWNGKYNLLQCERFNVYCCRLTNDDSSCCDDEEAVVSFSLGTLVLPTSTRTVFSAATAASQSSTPTTGSNGEVTCPADNSGSGDSSTDCPADNTAVVAASVGGVLGAALLASLGVIFVLWRRRRSPEPVAAPVNTEKYVGWPPQNTPHQYYVQQPIQELPHKPLHEMHG